LSYLFDCRLEVSTPKLTPTPTGDRRWVELTGGGVRGSALDGRLLDGHGNSTPRSLTDPTLTHVEIDFTIGTDAGETVACRADGVLDMPEDARERLGNGGTLPVDEIYFRVALRFTTSAPSLAWMNRITAIGVGSVFPRGVDLEIYQVL
jgi:hypothetical protein